MYNNRLRPLRYLPYGCYMATSVQLAIDTGIVWNRFEFKELLCDWSLGASIYLWVMCGSSLPGSRRLRLCKGLALKRLAP